MAEILDDTSDRSWMEASLRRLWCGIEGRRGLVETPVTHAEAADPVPLR